MKILHIIDIIASRSGGTAKVCLELSNYQVKAGHEVTICTTNRDFPVKKKLSIQPNVPLNVDGVNTFFFSAFTPLGFSVTMIYWLIKNISNYDIIHIHGLYRFPPTFGAWLARKKKKRYIIMPHGSFDPFLFKQSKYNVTIKRLYEFLFDIPNLNNASAIHYTATEEKELASFLNLRAPSVVIPNGIDWSVFENLPTRGIFRSKIGLDNYVPLILFLGRINFKKGLDILIPAFAKLNEKYTDIKLVIVGPDNDGYLKKVHQWVSDYKIENSIYFFDHLPIEEVKEAFVDADLFVLPSYTENFGISVVEAMACGCPVLISNKVNIWKEVEESGSGSVVDLNVEIITKKLEELINNKTLLINMGENGRKYSHEIFRWEKIVDSIDLLYNKLVNN